MFWLEPGLSPSSQSLASAATAHSALRPKSQLVDDILSPFETVRPGTEVFFHKTVGNNPHWSDKDVGRLRLRFRPNHTFSKVALFKTVPDGAISLRICTANMGRVADE